MNLTQWALKHQIPYAAVEDLRRLFGVVNTDPVQHPGESEAAVQNRVGLEASKKGCRLWRNNVGAGMLDNGEFIRWGIANESTQMNKLTKSSDLIGIRPLMITPQHVGTVVGVFLAREIKPGGWVYSGTEHEIGQLSFMELVASLGGDAAFAIGEGTI